MYTIIKINCDDQVLSFIEKPKIASGGQEENKIIFTFCERWTDYVKTAVFSVGDSDDEYEAPINDNNECVIPSYVTSIPDYVYVRIYGIKGSSTRTSNRIKFKVIRGALPDSNIIITWESVRSRLITVLNERFDAEISEYATVDDILNYIENIEDSKIVLELFVGILNTAIGLVNEQLLEADTPLPLLSTNMEDSEIESIISNNFDLIVKVLELYTSAMDITEQMRNEIFEDPETQLSIEHDITPDISDIRAYLRSLKTRLENFRGNVVNILQKDSITLESEDSDIIIAMSDTLGTLNTKIEVLEGVEQMIINSMYSLYTGGN